METYYPAETLVTMVRGLSMLVDARTKDLRYVDSQAKILQIREKFRDDVIKVILAMNIMPSQDEHPTVSQISLPVQTELSPQKKKGIFAKSLRPFVRPQSPVTPMAGSTTARASKLADDLIEKWNAMPGDDSSFHDVNAFDPLLHWEEIIKADPSMLPLAVVAMSFLGCKSSAAGCERIFSSASLIQDAVRNRLDTGMLEIVVFVMKNKDFVPEEAKIEEEYWRRRGRKAENKKKRKVSELSRAESQEQAPHVEADGNAADEICDEEEDNNVLVDVPPAFDGAGGEFGIEETYHFFRGLSDSRTQDANGVIPIEEEFEAYLTEIRNESYSRWIFNEVAENV
jgi:hypothetical protein